jgi:hypothetical protein
VCLGEAGGELEAHRGARPGELVGACTGRAPEDRGGERARDDRRARPRGARTPRGQALSIPPNRRTAWILDTGRAMAKLG